MNFFKNYSCVISLLFVPSFLWSQTFNWAEKIESNGTCNISGLTTDENENIYVTGLFEQDVTFDQNNQFTAIGDWDMFVAKYDDQGSFLWAKNYSSLERVSGKTLRVFDSHLYVSGSFKDTVDFDTSDPQNNLSISDNSTHSFILKLDLAGDFVSVLDFQSDEFIDINDFILDSEGNIIMTGVFSGVTDFDPSSGTNEVTANAFNDFFVNKIDESGSHIWTYRADQNGLNNYTGSLDLNDSDDVIVVGQIAGETDFGTSTSPNIVTPNSVTSGFILSLSKNMEVNWVQTFDGDNTDRVVDVVVDDNNEIILTGYFWGTLELEINGSAESFYSVDQGDIHVSKLNSQGEYVWVKHIGGQRMGEGSSVGVDQYNDVYVTGYFEGTKDFDPGSGVFELSSSDNNSFFNDVFVLKLNQNGDFNFALNFEGEGSEYGKVIEIFENSIYTAGEFNKTTDFDFAQNVFELEHTGTTAEEYGFIHKMTLNDLNTSDLSADIKNFVVYPNPTNEFLNLSTGFSYYELTVFDALGKVLYSENFENSFENQIDISSYRKGIYFVNIKHEDFDKTVKVIKD